MAASTFVFDLDGVVYRGNVPVPGAVTTIETLKQLGHQVYFFTNNATQTRTRFADKLRKMHIDTDDAHVMTSAYATALYLKDKGACDASVYVVGEHGLRAELEAIGMTLVDDPRVEKTDYVVAGLDRQFNYDKLTRAQQAILRGATFIATNTDATLPLEEGVVVPGGGAIVAAIAAAAGVKPTVIGKPELPAMCELLHIANATPESTIVVGDRLETDILAGNRAKTITVLTLTGISSREEAECALGDMRPRFIVEDLTEILSNKSILGEQPSI